MPRRALVLNDGALGGRDVAQPGARATHGVHVMGNGLLIESKKHDSRV